MTRVRSSRRAAALMLGAGMALGAQAGGGTPIQATPTESGWTVRMPSGTISIEALTPRILRLTFNASKQPSNAASLVIDPSSATLKATVRHDGDALDTDDLHASWSAAQGRLHVEDAAHHALLDVDVAALAKGRLDVTHASGDDIYGIHGYDAFENADGGLRRQGRSVAKAGEQGWAGAPYAWSTAGYGVLADVEGARFEVTGNKITARARHKGQRITSIYVFVGKPKELFGALAQVSGHTPLFPKWAMGFTNSQWGIDQQELLNIVDTYRAKHIPLDNITLDFDWKAWGEDHYGEFRWNERKFPGGSTGELKRTLDARGVRLTGIMKPRVHLDTEQGRYATEHGFWLAAVKPSPDYFSHQTVRDVDFGNPQARAWFFNDALKHSFDTGMVGWWNDEADNADSDTQFLNMQRAMYDGQRAHSDLRVWSMNRNFYLGSQRYAYGVWSGDIFTGFDSMKAQRQRMLSAINVGAMQWGMDGGGFKHGTPTPENYARWIQFGAFTPVFRVHGDFGQKRQPWVYGPVAEQAATEAIRLRYRLIPYIYAYERQRAETGMGIVRPLLAEWPQDARLREDVDAWLFGDYLLVSPVVDPGQQVKNLYLPPGRWTDFFSGKTYDGGREVQLSIDHERWTDIPLFIREGAIIPMQPLMDYVDEKPVTTLDVEMFPSTQPTSFTFYDDDGLTYAYEKGASIRQVVHVRREASKALVDIDAAEGHYESPTRFLVLRVHGLHGQRVIDEAGAELPRVASVDALAAVGGPAWTVTDDRFGPVVLVRVPAWQARHIAVLGSESP